jgi:hypothetical protein
MPADPSRPADVLRFGDRLVEVRLGVYAVDAVELATDRGEVLRCASPVCEMPTGRYGPVPECGREPAPAVDE